MDELERLKTLAGVANPGSMTEYKAEQSGSNISATAQEKIEKQKSDNIQPGTDEWFRLWFSKPYLTGENPFG
jgi:hypothetical protein